MKQKFTPEEKLTIQAYDNYAALWSQDHNDPNFWKEELNLFQQYLPFGKVLEIGCGGGRDAEQLINQGYDYIGTDVSQGLITEAQKLIPQAIFLQQSAYDLDFPVNSFDGFWSSAVLLHIPKSKIDQALTAIHKVIKKNGIGFISIKQGTGEKILKEKIGENSPFERLFTFYSLEGFGAILLKNGYEILASEIRPMSAKTIWLNFFVKVRK